MVIIRHVTKHDGLRWPQGWENFRLPREYGFMIENIKDDEPGPILRSGPILRAASRRFLSKDWMQISGRIFGNSVLHHHFLFVGNSETGL